MSTRGRPFFLALVAVTLAGPLSVHLFLPALPHVQQAFAVQEGAAQLSFSAAMLAMAVATLCYGSLSDRFGRLPVLVAGRILQGAGAASGMVMARTIVIDIYGTARLGQMLAYLTTAYVLGPMIAPPLGGMLTDALGWQSILIAPAVFGGLGLLIAIAVSGETRPGVDVPGVPLLHAYAGRLAGRVSGNALIIAGAIASVAGALCLPALIALRGLMPLSLFLPILVLALGQGLGMPHAQAAAINTDPRLAGTATGMIVFGQYAPIAAATQLVAMTADGTTVPMTVCALTAATAAAAADLAGVVLSPKR